MNIGSRGNVFFHETQVSDLCGKHALNNLIQRELFTAPYLNEISRRLSINEAALLLPSTEKTVFGLNGSYDIQVLLIALMEHQYTPIRLLDVDVVQRSIEMSSSAYLVSITGHFYAIRIFMIVWCFFFKLCWSKLK